MKRILFITVLTAILLLAACTNQTTVNSPEEMAPAATAEPTQPTPESTPETAPESTPKTAAPTVTIANDTAALFAGEVNKSAAISDIRCDLEKRTLTFTIVNHGQKTWQLSGVLPFPAPKDTVQAKIFINNYQANGLQPYYDSTTGDRLFGPNVKFSENCGGVEKLAPGESTTCSLTNVPLFSPDDIQNQKNHLWMDADIDSLSTVTFFCQE